MPLKYETLMFEQRQDNLFEIESIHRPNWMLFKTMGLLNIYSSVLMVTMGSNTLSSTSGTSSSVLTFIKGRW